MKGIVSRVENSFQGPKNQINTFYISADGFQIVWLPFFGENEK
jgi:hypothetical protein